MTTEFSHLYPGAGKIAALSAEERILRIRARSGKASRVSSLARAASARG